jgi:hypothetical protein
MDINILAQKIFKSKINAQPVHLAALCFLYVSIFQKDVSLISGYAVTMGQKECCRHYWVESELGQYDLAYEIACLYQPELEGQQIYLLSDLPEGYDAQEDPESENLFQIFKKNPKKFWNQFPKKLRELMLEKN